MEKWGNTTERDEAHCIVPVASEKTQWNDKIYFLCIYKLFARLIGTSLVFFVLYPDASRLP